MADPVTRALYMALVETDNVRYRQHPTGAAGVAVADDAAYDELIASTVITTIHWLAAVFYGIPAAGITTDVDEVLAEGIGGADGATVAFATLLVELQLMATIDTAVGEYPVPNIFLPVPIRVAASTRHAARISTSTTGGMAVTVALNVITGLAS